MNIKRPWSFSCWSSCGLFVFPARHTTTNKARGREGATGGLQGGYKGEGGSQGVYRRKEGRGAGQEELNGQVSVDLSRAYKHQA